MPAPILARKAIDSWLRQQSRKARRDAIAAYVAEAAGTNLDLDPDLESAGIEHLVMADDPNFGYLVKSLDGAAIRDLHSLHSTKRPLGPPRPGGV